MAVDKGWIHKPITKEKNIKSFIEAVEILLDENPPGNFAMALIEKGEVKEEVFHSIGQEVNRHTIFQVASLSKFVSATGVMKLVESRKMDLDAPVSQYLSRWELPPSEFDNEKVTIRRLLSHTAGLTDGLGYSGFIHPDSVQTLEESLTKAIDADPGRSGVVKVGIEPNTSWEYSGGGFTLLQLMVEEVSGQNFDVYMKESILQPLDMTSSTFLWSDSLNYRLCEFYNLDKTSAPHFYYSSLAATSLYTSLSDLEKFSQMFLGNSASSPVKEETLTTMQESHWDILGSSVYGLGTFHYVNLDDGKYIFGHDGKSTPPINTALRLNPITKDGIIILGTGDADLATRIASDWVFLKTGKVDNLLFLMLQEKMIVLMIAGVGVILLLLFLIESLSFRRKVHV